MLSTHLLKVVNNSVYPPYQQLQNNLKDILVTYQVYVQNKLYIAGTFTVLNQVVATKRKIIVYLCNYLSDIPVFFHIITTKG